jgi:hypothetical protein
MTPPRQIAAAAAAAAGTLVLAFPGVAGATAGAHNFEQSYPVASKLCVTVAKGGGPAKLRANAAMVLADCTTLQNEFNTARASVIATEAAIASALTTDLTTRRALCTSKPAHPIRCNNARRHSQHLHRRLGKQKLAAARAYWRTIEAFRAQFWAEIKALPGGKDLAPDKPIPVQDN